MPFHAGDAGSNPAGDAIYRGETESSKNCSEKDFAFIRCNFELTFNLIALIILVVAFHAGRPN